jgi:uncharacterized protein YutE (UPF0331/DUF86 family)
MKHWTEPNGILLMHIPIEWQYKNPVFEDIEEKSPYSFELYEDSVGCFQLSCYPLTELVPNHKGTSKPGWTLSRMDSEEFDTHLFFGQIDDQALIGKYIHNHELQGNERVTKQLEIVQAVLKSITIVPEKDRTLAASLDKHDQFLASLVASHDLLNSAVESESYIESIIVSANIIDAYLRLSIVITKQLRDKTDEIDVKYLFQAEGERGLMERSVFRDALELGVMNQSTVDELSDLYNLRNRIVHRYIISPIKTRDMVPVVGRYLEALEKIRLILREIEESQMGKNFGIYGRGFTREDNLDDVEIRRACSWANDKHLFGKYKRDVVKK